MLATERSDAFRFLLRAYPQPPKRTIPPPVRKNIRIENPISGVGFTSLNRAKRFLKRGLAEWVEVGASIRFIRDPRDHRAHCAACSQSLAEAAALRRRNRATVAEGLCPSCNAPAILKNYGGGCMLCAQCGRDYGHEKRRRDAERVGRVFKDAEWRRRRLLEFEVERMARAQQRAIFRKLISAWKHNPEIRTVLLQDLRPARREYAKRRYWDNPEKERARCNAAKHANPKLRGDARRRSRQSTYSDGSITVAAIQALFGAAKACPYCSDKFRNSRKSLDHIEPLVRGGGHSLRNVLICCWNCNQRKGAKSFREWLAMLDNAHQRSARRLYARRFGAPPEQGYFVLPWTA